MFVYGLGHQDEMLYFFQKLWLN